MDHKPLPGDELQRELAYYKKQVTQFSGESIRNDYILSSLRHELKQKREAFATLTILQRKLLVTSPIDEIFADTVRAIGTNLGMDRTCVLTPTSIPNVFTLASSHGFSDDQVQVLQTIKVNIPSAYLTPGKYILTNKATPPDEASMQLQQLFSINYFVAVPVIHNEEAIAFILAARQFEKLPFNAPLDKGDVDTLMAIAGLLSAVIQSKRMMELRLQKAEIEKQNEIITEQRDKLEHALNELKAAQAQLIHSEKMASLGELTAGIAHEIQNPLNFVNNFSEVSRELLDEMKTELDSGNTDEAKELADDVMQNLGKILHHGKRADGIVKGMLLHSRSSNGQKEPTDINELADEYLRLAYHGLRAKEKSFNATLQTDFDKSIGSIDIIPQDIGRVILNLITNAFYAASLPSEGRFSDPNKSDGPAVWVVTKKIDDRVLISVRDNGPGIPGKILDKIFQPFFTTKPTGEGTGLGLSLSYDIVKAHGGELKVDTKEGEGSTFIIILPANNQ